MVTIYIYRKMCPFTEDLRTNYIWQISKSGEFASESNRAVTDDKEYHAYLLYHFSSEQDAADQEQVRRIVKEVKEVLRRKYFTVYDEQQNWETGCKYFQ